jgi:hypothetical protein
MLTLLRCCLRLGLFAVGLVLVAGMVALFTLVLALWSVRAVWLKLTGRPVAPFVMRFGARDVFRRAAARPSPRAVADVIDVEARRLS